MEDGRIVDAGQTGGGRINVTRVGYGPASIAFTNPGLATFRAEITCAQVGITENEGATPVSVFLITSKGCNANPCTPASPPLTYVERQLQVTVTQ